MARTRWQDIYNHLKQNGIDVYSPGQHQGECTSPYTVVKLAGSSQLRQFSSTQALYYLLCYVPAERYSLLEEYVNQVKDVMRGLQPMIMPTHTETPSYYDVDVHGHMISIEYRNSRTIPC